MRLLLVILIILLICMLLFGCDRPAAQAPQNDSTPKMTILPRVSATNTGARPLDGLSSNNPQERLQIVRQAQDKWGATKVAANIDQKDILGLWDIPRNNASFLMFWGDGTMTTAGVFSTIKGTYRLLSSNSIEFTLPGIVYGQNTTVWEYRLLGDTLELKFMGDWVAFRRVPPPRLLPPPSPPINKRPKPLLRS